MISYGKLKDDGIYQILDFIPAAIYWKDLEGRYLGCNDYLLNLLSVASRELIIGKTDHDLFSQKEADNILEIDSSVIKDGYYNGEELFIINGNSQTYLSNKMLLRDEGGKFAYY